MPTLDALAVALRDLLDELDQTTVDPDLWKQPGSGYASSLASIEKEAPHWGDEGVAIVRRVYWDTAKYSSAVRRHARGIAALVSEREPFLSPWPVLRAQLEFAGRMAWILEPFDVDESGEPMGIPARRRAGRYFLDALASACYRRKALAEMKSRHKTSAKREREHLHAEVVRLFETACTWEQPGSELTWSIDGDRYASLARGAQLYARHLQPGLDGLYDALSGYSHPSIRFLDEGLDEDRVEDWRFLHWRIEPEIVAKQVHYAGSFAFQSARLLLSHLGGTGQDRIDEAMDRFESTVAPA